MSCILALIGGLLIADTVYALTQVRCNIGVVLPAVLGAPLFIAGIFYSQIINAATGNNLVHTGAFHIRRIHTQPSSIRFFTMQVSEELSRD